LIADLNVQWDERMTSGKSWKLVAANGEKSGSSTRRLSCAPALLCAALLWAFVIEPSEAIGRWADMFAPTLDFAF
jgi:hypothetical protein